MKSLLKYRNKSISLRIAMNTGFHVGFTWGNTCYTILKYIAMTVFLYATFGGTIEWE